MLHETRAKDLAETVANKQNQILGLNPFDMSMYGVEQIENHGCQARGQGCRRAETFM